MSSSRALDGRRTVVAQVFRPAVLRRAALAVACVLLAAALAAAQAPEPAEKVSFNDAVQRAIEKNPSSAIAAAGILRAQALLMEARAGTRLQINGTVTTTTLNRGVEFQ